LESLLDHRRDTKDICRSTRSLLTILRHWFVELHSENFMLEVKCILSTIPYRLILFQNANGNGITLLNEIFDQAIEFGIEPAIENYVHP
jgi:hypothetical protein